MNESDLIHPEGNADDPESAWMLTLEKDNLSVSATSLRETRCNYGHAF